MTGGDAYAGAGASRIQESGEKSVCEKERRRSRMMDPAKQKSRRDLLPSFLTKQKKAKNRKTEIPVPTD